MPFDGSTFIRHVAERLIHEFAFSQGAGTPGLIGAAKEHPARIQLERLMPGGVGVGSGIVVDSYGGVSRQQDVVIYEKLCPVFTHNGAPEATYYPVEGVIAVGEIKSGLGKNELMDAIEKSLSVKKLIRHAVASNDGLGEPAVSFRKYGNGTSFSCTPEEQFDQKARSLDQCYSFVLCQRFAKEAEALLDDLVTACRSAGRELAPNIITSLEDGSIYPFNSLTRSITRSMMEGDGAMLSLDPIGGFAQLMAMLRLYVIAGRTVERQHFERYFKPIGAGASTFPVNAYANF